MLVEIYMRNIFGITTQIQRMIDGMNDCIVDVKTGFMTLLIPMKLIAWVCLILVSLDGLLGRGNGMAQRTISGAFDQFWYAVFYFSLPMLWKFVTDTVEGMRRNRDWIVVRPDSPTQADDDDDEWVIVTEEFDLVGELGTM